ncbi:dihydroneopterin triphosphate diphosphatase [Chromobacterium haemolyticum]|uniref:Dihydroneopterin triphosphate diphosphatase n=1 Tax=Chromobacterium haemolyticum TaxID=394935 RepID=A0A1W0CTH8_9NEIS|nr:dihydroneopterin triphosphate diphosphatase [Chromobacterium haemolyticum]OQS38070.1 dihydroneopterin triphosphate diphosphatase [Chromobacterium haemolyticum]
MGDKQPVSVLVVIHTVDGQALLIERADKPGYWQSVTGSREGEEALRDTALRELAEETGLVLTRDDPRLSDWGLVNRYEIYPHWRHRYPEGVTHNDEHVFGLCLERPVAVTLAPREHLAQQWLPWDEAADKVFSPSNAEALRMLPQKLALVAARP